MFRINIIIDNKNYLTAKFEDNKKADVIKTLYLSAKNKLEYLDFELNNGDDLIIGKEKLKECIFTIIKE
jgi:hypothetical protein